MRLLAAASLIILILAGACSTARTSPPAVNADSPHEVARGVLLLPGAFVPGHQPDGNSVLFQTRSGLVVVDTGRHAEHTQRIIDYAHTIHRPIIAIINTHWHLDHTSGNLMMRRAFPSVRVYASLAIEEAMSGFLADYRKQLQEIIPKTDDAAARRALETEAAVIDSGNALYPDEPIMESGPRTFDGKKLDVHLETHAVTAGDIWLFDRSSGVLVSGDLVTFPVPFLDTACPGRWSESLSRLSAVGFKTLIPGHGPAMNREQFESFRRGFDALLACAATSASKESCGTRWLTEVGSLVPETDHPFARALLDYYLEQSLRGDASQSRRLCGNS